MIETVSDVWLDHLFQLRHQLKPYSAVESRLLFHAICDFSRPHSEKFGQAYLKAIDQYCQHPLSGSLWPSAIQHPTCPPSDKLLQSGHPALYFHPSPYSFPEISLARHVIRVALPAGWSKESILHALNIKLPHAISWQSFPVDPMSSYLPQGFTPIQYCYLVLTQIYFPYLLAQQTTMNTKGIQTHLRDNMILHQINWADKIAVKVFRYLGTDNDFLLALTNNRISQADAILLDCIDRLATVFDNALLQERLRKRHARRHQSTRAFH